jgi:antitoxin ParD1/3/4
MPRDDESEAARERLRALEESERVRQEARAEVQQKINEGLASLDRGDGLDGEAMLAKLEKRLSARDLRS